MTRTLSRALFGSAVLLIAAGLAATVLLGQDLAAIALLSLACVPLAADVWLTYHQESNP